MRDAGVRKRRSGPRQDADMESVFKWTKRKPTCKGWYLVFCDEREVVPLHATYLRDKQDIEWIKSVPRYHDAQFCGPIKFPGVRVNVCRCGEGIDNNGDGDCMKCAPRRSK